ncbi:MAG: hypothetical protein JST04_16075 [Bdellovibrionales bacterium]|nr:hypothetical protein [Bdellovibrionales bacterium]
MALTPIQITPEEKEVLRSRFLATSETVPLASDPKFFALVTALGIQQEIGTIHDELSVFLFDGDTGAKIPRENLRAEVVDHRGHFGVRIRAEGHAHLDPRVPGLRTLLDPAHSYGANENIHSLVFFPEVVTRIAALQGAELVSVRPWGINTVFGGFDPAKSYYEGNMWEFVNVDAVRYAELLADRRIVFFGTHDLVSHVAGLRSEAWPELSARGARTRDVFRRYFAGVDRPAPFAAVLPYALGMLLDDLAQPMNYASESRKHVVELLIEALETRKIGPRERPYLLKYPPSIERLIASARSDDPGRARREAGGILAQVVEELRRHAAA